MPEDNNGILKRWVLVTATSTITALLLQSGALLWWGGSINARVYNVENQLEQVSQRVLSLETKLP